MSDAKVLSLKQLKAKKYKFLPDVPENISASFGVLIKNFIMIAYGDSGNGKSNLIVQLLKVFTQHGNCLYVALEEGHGYSMQRLVNEHLGDEYSGKVMFADHTMTYSRLCARLEKQRKEQFIIIDSVQYWDIDYEMYKALKERFPQKTFIFISHAKGKKPEGKTASDIEYDATIKIRVQGYIGFMKSRLGGNKPYVIWEEGARRYWGDKEFEKIVGIKKEKKKTTKAKQNETVKNEKDTNHDSGLDGGNSDSVQPGGDTSSDRPSADRVAASECSDLVDQK